MLVVVGVIFTTGIVVHSKRIDNRLVDVELSCVFSIWEDVRFREINMTIGDIHSRDVTRFNYWAFGDRAKTKNTLRFVNNNFRTRDFIPDYCIDILLSNEQYWVFHSFDYVKKVSIIEYISVPTDPTVYDPDPFHRIPNDPSPLPATTSKVYQKFIGKDIVSVSESNVNGLKLEFVMMPVEDKKGRDRDTLKKLHQSGFNAGVLF